MVNVHPKVVPLLIRQLVVTCILEAQRPRYPFPLTSIPFCVELKPGIEKKREAKEQFWFVLNLLGQFGFLALALLPDLKLYLRRILVKVEQNAC